jgi:hypothetical protein
MSVLTKAIYTSNAILIKIPMAFITEFEKLTLSWGLVVHTYNPSYSGDRDQEDLGLKPARANSL